MATHTSSCVVVHTYESFFFLSATTRSPRSGFLSGKVFKSGSTLMLLRTGVPWEQTMNLFKGIVSNTSPTGFRVVVISPSGFNLLVTHSRFDLFLTLLAICYIHVLVKCIMFSESNILISFSFVYIFPTDLNRFVFTKIILFYKRNWFYI